MGEREANSEAAEGRLADQFLQRPGLTLAQFGYEPDPGRVRGEGERLVFYHYAHEDRVAAILADDGGLRARPRPVLEHPNLPAALKGCHLVEGLLDPMPQWARASPYFGDLGLEMLRRYVGPLLLRIELPVDTPGVYVADFAHVLEAKHALRRGRAPLGLGYKVQTGEEVGAAELHSYIPVQAYAGEHVAPLVKFFRRGPGLCIPSRYIRIADEQPLMPG